MTRHLRARLLLLTALPALVLFSLKFRINWRYASAPKGLYYIATDRACHRGDLALVCLGPEATPTTLARKISPPGRCPAGAREALKTIAALPGDLVQSTSLGLRVNGHLLPLSRRFPVDSAGRQLPRPKAASVVPPDLIWVRSATHERSWDSRYFGPIPATGTIGRAYPLLTF